MTEAMETIQIVQEGVTDSQLGALYRKGVDYRVPKAHADIRYQRGHARPAAEVYLERLRKLGVVGVRLSGDAEPSVRLAASRLGIACNSDGK